MLGISLALSTFVPVNLMIRNWFEEKRGFVTGIVFAGSGAGGFVFTQVIIISMENYGYRMSYIILGICILLITLPFTLFIVKLKLEEIGQVAYGSNKVTNSLSNETSDGFCFKEIKGHTSLNALLLSVALMSFITLGIISQLPAYLSDKGYTLQFIGIINSIFMLSLTLTKPVLGIIFDKTGVFIGVLIGGLTIFASLFLLNLANSNIIVIGFVFLFSFGGGLATIAPPFITGSLFGKKDYSTIYGIVTLASALGGSFSSPLVGFIYDITKNYTLAWILFMPLSLFFIFLIWVSESKAKSLYKVNT